MAHSHYTGTGRRVNRDIQQSPNARASNFEDVRSGPSKAVERYYRMEGRVQEFPTYSTKNFANSILAFINALNQHLSVINFLLFKTI